MSTVTCVSEVDEAALARLLEPRLRPAEERRTSATTFELERGPFAPWRRSVEIERLGPDRLRVVDRVDFHIAVPLWGLLFVRPVKRRIRAEHRRLVEPGAVPHRRTDPRRAAFWEPPDQLDATAATVLGIVCTLSVVVGYLGTLITQSITFASSQFHATNTEQSGTLAAVRVGVLLALVLVALADRRGRRRLLLWSIVASCLTAALGAASPDLWFLGVSQTASRGFSTAAILLLGVVAVEEMPAGSRAFAAGVMTLTSALGAGMCVWFLPLADVGKGGWRFLYLIPLAGLPVVAWAARHLPETRRFVRQHSAVAIAGHGRRLWLLGTGLFCAALFAAPASQLQNQFLRGERGFSAARITLFTLTTSTPGGIGVAVGGRLSDVHGRRLVAAVGTIGGAVCTAVSFLVHGWPLWIWSLTGTVFAGAAVPSLAVYGPELFPTGLRGKANGILQTAAVAGSSMGLLAAGAMSDHFGTLGPGMVVLALGPILLAAMVVRWYPETAHLELELLNPEDLPIDPPQQRAAAQGSPPNDAPAPGGPGRTGNIDAL